MENNNPPVPPNENENDINKQFNEQFGNDKPNQNRNTDLNDINQNNPNKINQNVNPYENVNPQGGQQGPFNQGGFNQGPQYGGGYNQGNYNQGQGGNIPPQMPYGQGPGSKGLPVPNSTGVLVLGILSLILWLCYSFPGLICAIIALILAKKANEDYLMNPAAYDQASYSNLKAGRVCAIIGLILAIIYILFFAIIIIIAVSNGGRGF